MHTRRVFLHRKVQQIPSWNCSNVLERFTETDTLHGANAPLSTCQQTLDASVVANLLFEGAERSRLLEAGVPVTPLRVVKPPATIPKASGRHPSRIPGNRVSATQAHIYDQSQCMKTRRSLRQQSVVCCQRSHVLNDYVGNINRHPLMRPSVTGKHTSTFELQLYRVLGCVPPTQWAGSHVDRVKCYVPLHHKRIPENPCSSQTSTIHNTFWNPSRRVSSSTLKVF